MVDLRAFRQGLAQIANMNQAEAHRAARAFRRNLEAEQRASERAAAEQAERQNAEEAEDLRRRLVSARLLRTPHVVCRRLALLLPFYREPAGITPA